MPCGNTGILVAPMANCGVNVRTDLLHGSLFGTIGCKFGFKRRGKLISYNLAGPDIWP